VVGDSTSSSEGEGEEESEEVEGESQALAKELDSDMYIPPEKLVPISQTIILEEPEEEEEEEEEEEDVVEGGEGGVAPHADAHAEAHAEGDAVRDADGAHETRPKRLGVLQSISERKRSGISLVVTSPDDEPEAPSPAAIGARNSDNSISIGGATASTVASKDDDSAGLHAEGVAADASHKGLLPEGVSGTLSPARSRSNSAVALALAMLDDKSSLEGEPLDDEERTEENEYGLRTPIVSLKSARSRPTLSTMV
jgi:hypothetical protein